jgi:transcriptional regulator with XRE-family HTH domain
MKTKQVLACSVKDLRKGLGLSQEAFAGLCDIDRTYASQIERAIANPSLEILCDIAEVLGVSVCQLLDSSFRK